jgi:hypothetical protein
LILAARISWAHFSVAADKPAEISGRTRERLTAKVGKSRFHPGIGEGCINLLVEPIDNVG